MAQERELVSPHELPADRRQADQRWPVPYAIVFITLISVALWTLIIVAGSWLAG